MYKGTTKNKEALRAIKSWKSGGICYKVMYILSRDLDGIS